MVEIFAGKWKLDRSENFEEYLKEMGVGMMKRGVAKHASQTVVFTVDGNHVHIKTTTTFSTQENDFTIGQKFRTPAFGLADGEYEALPTFEDGKLSYRAEPVSTSLKATDITRELVNGELKMTMKCGDVVCTRFFKKD